MAEIDRLSDGVDWIDLDVRSDRVY